MCHINAEQKRRCNIKNGFDTLHALIPQLNHNPNAKVLIILNLSALNEFPIYVYDRTVNMLCSFLIFNF